MTNVFKILRGVIDHPLSKRDKIGTIYRFVSWQMEKKKYVDTGKLIDWVCGTKLYIFPGRSSGTGQYYNGLLEFQEMSFMLHYANNTDRFIDCGANVGVYSVLLGNATGGGYAVEPSRDTYKILQKNIHANGFDDKVKLIRAGAGNKRGQLRFSMGLDSVNHILSGEEVKDTNYEEIDVITIDSIDDKDITILKIDVEGYEKEVLEGADVLLSSEKLNVVLLETFGEPELEKILVNKGFKMYCYNAWERQLLEMTTNNNSDNGIFIRDLELAKRRLALANKVKVGKFYI